MKRGNIAFLGLGSNLGDPERQLLVAFDEIAATPGIRLLARSSLYRSAPVGFRDQPDFVNAVAKIRTALPPRELLAALQAIEARHGRERDLANGPRTLDLDILTIADRMDGDGELTLPHPRMHERAFVLHPLLEIAPEFVIPGRGRAADWAARCADQTISRIAGGSAAKPRRRSADGAAG